MIYGLYLPDDVLEKIYRKLLLGAVAVHPQDLFSVERSVPHGHVKAILGMMHQLKLDTLIAEQILPQTQIDHLKEHPGIGWISCLRFDAIRELVNQGVIKINYLLL